MKKIIYRTLALLYVLLFVVGYSCAQEIKIKSFSRMEEPMTIPMQRLDNNNKICALVKVIIPTDNAAFEGSLIGNCDYKTSEYWCYLSPGSRFLKVKYPGCDPLLVDFKSLIGSGVESKCIYELKLRIPPISQSHKTYVVKIDVNSSETSTLLGHSFYSTMDSLKVKQFNANGTYIDSYTPNQSVLSLMESGIYKFDIGASIGDRFEISALGYSNVSFVFDDPMKTNYAITLTPQRSNLSFLVKDSITGKPLIGATVFKNKKDISKGYSDWDNWYSQQKAQYDEASITDLDGMTVEFQGCLITDKFTCSYAGYKIKSGSLNSLFAHKNDSTNVYTIELEPYNKNEDIPLCIEIGGMGTNDRGNVTILNLRTQESFLMSQKANENRKYTNVRIGDELLFTRKGYSPVSIKFKYHIPEEIRIAPIKGNKNDVQYLDF